MRVGTLVSPSPVTAPTLPRLSLPATLQLGTLSLPLSALIDSGAEDNFIDLNLAKQADIPLESLPFPIHVTTIDSRFLAKVTQHTISLTLVLSIKRKPSRGNHLKSSVSFLVPSHSRFSMAQVTQSSHRLATQNYQQLEQFLSFHFSVQLSLPM